MSLMLIYGEFGAIARISECFSLLINGGSVASVSYALETLPSMVGESSLHGMEVRSSTVSAGVPLKLLAQLFWISACGSCVFP